MPVEDDFTITVLYDNRASDPELQAEWGFAALVEHRGQTALFDTGGNGSLLVENMKTLGIDPATIEQVVLSHEHWDHIGGMKSLMDAGAKPTVHLLPSFKENYKSDFSIRGTVNEVTSGQSFGEGLTTTGEIGGSDLTLIPEQALVIRTGEGLIVITGCAHPGIVRVVEEAVKMDGGASPEPILLVLGGFHLFQTPRSEVAEIISEFRRLGVRMAGPCHCSGDQAMAMFAEAYGEDFVSIGTGTVIRGAAVN